MRLRTLNGRAYEVSRSMGWDELRRVKERVKGLGASWDGWAWEIPVYTVLQNGGEVEEFLKKNFGDDAVRKYQDYRRELDREIDYFGRAGYLILIKPRYVYDKDAYRLLKHFQRFSDSATRHYLFFKPETVKVLEEKYGPHFSLALKRLKGVGVVVIGGPKEASKEAVIEVKEGGDGDFIFDVSNPVVKEVVVKAVKDAVKEMGGSNFSLLYNERRIDEDGRPYLRTKRFPLARFLDDFSKVAVKAVLLPKVVERLRREGIRVEGLPAREWEALDVELRDYKLRPYQEEALRNWWENGRKGIVVLPTGGGKTLVALSAIARLKLPTLIVVPTRELVEQWRSRITKVLGVPEEEVGVGKEVKPITITTYNNLARNWRKYVGKFALVITDETHHVSAPTYLKALSSIDAPFRLGLTATPERQDQNTHVIIALTGNPVIKRTPLDLMRKGYLAPVRVEFVEVKPTPEEEEEYLKVLRESKELRGRKRAAFKNKARAIVQMSEEKTKKIVDMIGDMLRKGRKVIVFCEFVKQTKDIAEALRRKYGEDVAVELYSDMSKKARKRSLQLFKEGKAKVLVVTPAGNEGLDIPSADTAVFASFKRSEISFIQRIGRVMRPLKDKVSRVYVIYTPYERDLVSEFREYINKYIPQDKVEEVINALASKAKEHLMKEVTETVRKEGKRVRKRASLLGKHLPPFIKAILWKPVRALSKEDKIRLIEYVLSVKGTYAFKQDAARAAKRKARYVYTWLKDPTHSDIPGIDTPQGKKLITTALRRLKRKRDWFATVHA